MMQMTWDEIYPWYKEYEEQIAEEIIINKYSKENKPIPSGQTLERLVKNKIKEWHSPLVEE